jgi:vacuolar-type H+-ATPase subunit I/STV1|tara:strand:+ start:3417 stop:3884 length:468 start_codon:yes stop_codon:yes gene_type:complete
MDIQSTPSNIYLIDSNNKREKREPDNSLIYINNPIMPDIEEIAEKDKKILILRDLLQQNKEELNVNQVKINAETKNNSYLNDVLKNYHSYKSYIINMKKRQKEAMENISTHLEKIATENTLGEENLERVNLEQNQILDELDKIKKDLQELTLKSE